MRERFENGLTFPEYLETVEKHEDLWRGVYERAEVSTEARQTLSSLPGTWHLLTLSEDWCGDAVNIVPFVARLAEAAPNVDLRILGRDANPDLMDAHLTNGKSRSIPVVMVLDDQFEERAWWGPRPTKLQAWVMNEGMQMEPALRYKETRTFYARDRGQTTVDEILAVLSEAAGG